MHRLLNRIAFNTADNKLLNDSSNLSDIESSVKNNNSFKDFVIDGNTFTNDGNKIYLKFLDLIEQEIREHLIDIVPELKQQALSASEIRKKVVLFLINNKDKFKSELLNGIFAGDIDNDYAEIYNRFIERLRAKDLHILTPIITDTLNNLDISDENITSLRLITKYILNEIYQYLNKHLNEILSAVKFPCKENGTYTFAWKSDIGKIYSASDSIPVIEYLKNNTTIRDKILSSIDTSHINDLNQDWSDILDIYLHSDIHKSLNKRIRDYVMHLNDDILQQRADNLENNGDKINDSTYIDYNPTADHEREKPVIIYRAQFDNGTYKDLVLLGQQGASHGEVIYFDLVNKLEEIGALPLEAISKYEMTMGYLIGRIAFIDPKLSNTYSDWDEVKDILIRDPRIDKVYTVPVSKKDNGYIVRVARR